MVCDPRRSPLCSDREETAGYACAALSTARLRRELDALIC
jgi:hypothetical protein